MENTAPPIIEGVVIPPEVDSNGMENFEIEAEQNIKWTIDGEFAGEEKNVKIENMQKKIELAIYQK